MRFILSSLFMLISWVAIAQAQVTSSAISIQGIAKSTTNVALANETNLSCQFEIYYLGEGNEEKSLLSETVDLRTDAYGVFQYVLEIDETIFHKIGNTEAYIKVSHRGEAFTNEKLGVVPYAIYAQNSFITGSIVAFVGNNIQNANNGGDVPSGWLYCDGSQIPSGAQYDALRELIGNNVPDLRGWMLRGTGESGDNEDYIGPSLGTTQAGSFKFHLHDINNMTTNFEGSHSHNLRVYSWQSYSNEPEGVNDDDFKIISDDHAQLSWREGDLEDNGNHSHLAFGFTQYQSSVTPVATQFFNRPVNYGVAYIIKI